MTWSIQIDIPQQDYKGGDTVSGFVSLMSQHVGGQDVDVGSITIELTGRSTTKSWHRRTRSIQFLSFKENLLDGPKRVHASYGQCETTGSNIWPFSFTLPRTCSASAYIRRSRPPLLPFNFDPNQPLPASFADADIQGACSIVYALQAKLEPPLEDGRDVNRGCTEEVYISVYRPRSIEQPMFEFDSQCATFKYRSSLFSPKEEREHTHRSLTIKERLESKLPSCKRSPKAVFTIRVETPSDAILGQQLPILLHVEYDLNASTAQIPIFYLKGVSIHIREETSIWWLKSWNQEILLQKKAFEIQRPRVDRSLDLSSVIDTTIDHDLTPTFESFNVARAYSLKVSVRLECAGKEQLVFGGYKPLTLHTRAYDSQTAAHHVPELGIDEEDIGPPPPYHMATQEAVPAYSTRAAHAGGRGQGRTMQNEAAVSEAAESLTFVLSRSAALTASTGPIFFMSF